MKFEIGDEVWCASFGDGVVVQLVENPVYPCVVKFYKPACDRDSPPSTESFTAEGKRNFQDVAPSMYHKGVKIIEHKPERAPKNPIFEPFQRVLVRDEDRRDWICTIFSHETPKEDEYRYVCVEEWGGFIVSHMKGTNI